MIDIGVFLLGPPNETGGSRDASRRREANYVISSPDLREFAVHAEHAGFDSIWVPDHIIIPAKYASRYPYQSYTKAADFARFPYDESPFPEVFTALAYLAGATNEIRLGAGVLVLPNRNPVLLAKQLATLDCLSGGGRLLMGIGVGWLREEFEALGVSWPNRGRRTDEYISAMRALWTDDPATYNGTFVSFDKITCDPKPIGGEIPFIIGGHSEAAARRAGALGNGFWPLNNGGGRGDVKPLLDIMKRSAAGAGRDPDQILLHMDARADPKVIEQLEGQGVKHVHLVHGPTDLDAGKRWLDDIAANVLRPYRGQ